jgi:hypothetical protein
MKIVPIFVSANVDDGLSSIHLSGEAKNEFDNFFDLLNDIEWLYNFFIQNRLDLNSGYFGNISVKTAISRTLDEAQQMENLLYDLSEKGFASNSINLQSVFRPLNNFEYAIVTHQKSKAKVRRGWLRLYAIRLAENCYLVTGGAIKLTFDMRRGHLQLELNKLEQAKRFLRANGIDYPEDLNTYNNE